MNCSAPLGAKRLFDDDRFITWGKRPGPGLLSVCKPYDGEAARVGNGVMVALCVRSNDLVDAAYARARSLGAADASAPGFRGERFYGAYFRDLNGNKLRIFLHAERLTRAFRAARTASVFRQSRPPGGVL